MGFGSKGGRVWKGQNARLEHVGLRAGRWPKSWLRSKEKKREDRRVRGGRSPQKIGLGNSGQPVSG